MPTSAECKMKARAALKGHWLTALLIALTVNLPTLLVQGISAFSGLDLAAKLQELTLPLLNKGSLDPQAYSAALRPLLDMSGVWVMQGLGLIARLITPCLAMGMYVWMLGRLRGEEQGYGTVFSRLRLFLKGILLKLYTALKIFLWMLPGLVLCVAAMLPMVLGVHPGDGAEKISRMMSLSLTLYSLAAAAMCVPAVIAAFRYLLADIVMADVPSTGVVASVRESKRLTANRKGRLFALLFSFILWYLAEMALGALILNTAGAVPSLMAQMLAQLALTVYMQTSLCAFYRDISGNASVVPAGPEEKFAE